MLRSRRYGCTELGLVVNSNGRKAVDLRRVRGGIESGLAERIERHWIGTEVVIERIILVEDHDHVLNRGCGGLVR